MGLNNNLKTLFEMIQENVHSNEKNMILKMDIEGGEWNILNEINSNILLKFKYIIVEFHINNTYLPIYSNVFKKLNKTHQIFHLHRNNCCGIIKFDGVYICAALEISYVIRENNKFILSSDNFPVKNIDFPNIKNRKDINDILNIYQFENIFQSG